MKKIWLIVMLVCGMATAGSAQDKVEQYCEMVVYRGSFSESVNAKIVYGRNSLIISSDQVKVKKDFDSLPDALNYMGALGWKIVNSEKPNSETSGWTFIFKKEFAHTEEKVSQTN